MTVIPPDALAPETLNALIEEFITRSGAVHGQHDVSISQQIAGIRRQVQRGDVIIVFDEESETCTLMPNDPRAHAQ